jgi:D-arginine dehydrogenase
MLVQQADFIGVPGRAPIRGGAALDLRGGREERKGMASADFIVIGGGIAGLSAAARLARHGRTVVLEAEEAVGTHSSGRSATMVHYGIGDGIVRGLTAWSRGFFEGPPPGFVDHPLGKVTPALFVASEEMLPTLRRLRGEMERFAGRIEAVDEPGMLALCPVLKTGAGALVAGLVDREALRLDPHALLQGCLRAIRSAGGEVLAGRRVTAVRRRAGDWEVATESGECWTAPVLVNAAGAWADSVAAMAGVRPLGLRPLRRTIIVFDSPRGLDVRGWPFVKTAVDAFYMLPEAGRLLASPTDEVESDACDAQPEEYDRALAAWRVEEFTAIKVERIAHSWAGLRTFTRDRAPAAGFAPDAPGFFWLAGQGGFGLQTAPAMAAAVEALITSGRWPDGLAELGVLPEALRPDRLH